MNPASSTSTVTPETLDPGAVTSLADIPAMPLRWLWPGRIPIGKFTLLAGASAVGKSVLALDLAARISTGRPFPGQSTSPSLIGGAAAAPGNVLLLTTRHHLADVIRPRLDAAHADPARIITASDFTPEAIRTALDRLLALPASPSVGHLIIIDPLPASYTASQFATEPASIHSAFPMLMDAACANPLAILALTSLRPGCGSPLQRLRDASRLLAHASSVFVVSPDHREENPDPTRLLLAPLKNNLGPLAPPLAFSIRDGAVAWSPDNIPIENSESILNIPRPPSGPDPVHLEKCAHWLYEQLTPRPRPAAEVLAAARANGFSIRTLYRAKNLLNVKSRNQDKQWYWKIDGTDYDSLRQMDERMIFDSEFDAG